MGAERKVQQQAPVVWRETIGDASPEGAVRENAVQEDKRQRSRRTKLGDDERASGEGQAVTLGGRRVVHDGHRVVALPAKLSSGPGLGINLG